MNDDLISRTELKKCAIPCQINNGALTDLCVPLYQIDNTPTVEITEEQAIDKLHDTGWLPLHDKEMTERPTDKWISVSERLPEDMQRVLIWFEYYRYGDYNCMYQTYGFGYVCDGKWSPFINGETGWQDARIIAWLPLPEAYKEV